MLYTGVIDAPRICSILNWCNIAVSQRMVFRCGLGFVLRNPKRFQPIFLSQMA